MAAARQRRLGAVDEGILDQVFLVVDNGVFFKL